MKNDGWTLSRLGYASLFGVFLGAIAVVAVVAETGKLITKPFASRV